ncbi:MAG TPA: SAM-dependent methyltransferase [Candidatus Faecousia intestinigallinarum]|nr:SAM-dependent methyltransferase [Candidatus Faecousia intestinigallinarum]
MPLPITCRLLACCNYVNQGDRVADIGCDHGYLGIYLLQQGIAASVIAADVNAQPLRAAMSNAVKYGIREKMTFYLSDGVQNIPRDFDALVCAGMGADTIISILGSAPWLKSSRCRLILQCQSKRPELRRWLNQAGYTIRRETLAQDGRFLYPVLEAIYAPAAPLRPGEAYISPALLASGSPLLPAFYARVKAGLETAVSGLTHGRDAERLKDYQADLSALMEMEESIYGDRR